MKGVNILICHTDVCGKNLYANFEEDHPATLGSPVTVQSEGKDRIECNLAIMGYKGHN